MQRKRRIAETVGMNEKVVVQNRVWVHPISALFRCYYMQNSTIQPIWKKSRWRCDGLPPIWSNLFDDIEDFSVGLPKTMIFFFFYFFSGSAESLGFGK